MVDVPLDRNPLLWCSFSLAAGNAKPEGICRDAPAVLRAGVVCPRVGLPLSSEGGVLQSRPSWCCCRDSGESMVSWSVIETSAISPIVTGLLAPTVGVRGHTSRIYILIALFIVRGREEPEGRQSASSTPEAHNITNITEGDATTRPLRYGPIAYRMPLTR
jgi:hypothetical protein